MTGKRKKLAIVVSHPIQHFCPLYRSFSKNPTVEVKVFFASAIGYKQYQDKNFSQSVVWNNLKLDEFNHVFLNGDALLPSNKDLDAPTIMFELERFRPDGIITYGYFQKFQRRVHDWANNRNVPLFYISDAENRQYRPKWKRIFKFCFLRWYLKKINYFLTVGDENESYYKLYGVSPDRFIRMHYSIDIELYRNAYQKKDEYRHQIHTEYGVGSNEIVISVVGKLVEWKNQGHLIDLLHRLEQKQIKAHLFILGTGPQMEQLKEQSTKLKFNQAYFPGFVDPLDLPKFYAASDIYIHPAKVEPHSLAISEAIYMSCPIIISNTCGSYGPTDDVQENKNGFIYKFGDLDMLEKFTVQLIQDKTMRMKFAEYSHEIAEKFQRRAHVECLEDIIRKI